MHRARFAFRSLAGIAAAVACCALVAAQGLDPAALLNPPSDSWPTYHGDYSGRRHSRLKQITPENVHQLTLAWAFQTGQPGEIKGSPILVNGTIYVTTPDNLWAVDARTARPLWRYTYPTNQGFHIGHRGAAVYKDSVYLTTPDAHLVALDARDGKVKWTVQIADARRGYWSTNAPLVVGNHLIVGVSGDFDNLPGMLTSVDPETGKTQWIFYSTPPPGTPVDQWRIDRRPDVDHRNLRSQAQPRLRRHRKPHARAEWRRPPGDNPWTCSIVAINPDTGKLAWGFQASPHDTHDWDAAEVPCSSTPSSTVAAEAAPAGIAQRLFLRPGPDHRQEPVDDAVFDRELGKGIDKDGRPIPNPDKEPARDGRLVTPDEGGGTNYRSPSFDPATGLFIVSARDAYGIYFFKPEHGTYGWAGADYGVHSVGALRAIDYRTGKVRWNHDIGGGSGAGVLTTDTGVTFSGDGSTNVLALRTSDGATLWHSSNRLRRQLPDQYELDGRQYMVVAGGSALYAWTLPEKAVPSTSTR